MRRALHIAVLLLVAVTLSCRGPRLIPRDELADIYYEMFLADQQVRDDAALRRQADTMLVYEAVFNRYGYDTDDYLYSVRTYLKDPERFAKLMEGVGDRLQREIDGLQGDIEQLDWNSKFMNMKRPPIEKVLARFSRDSLYKGAVRVVEDTTGAFRFRLEGLQKDTLMIPVPADTLSAQTDTLEHE